MICPSNWAVWKQAMRDRGQLSAQALSCLHIIAVEIFTSSIYPKTADFPINIESYIRTTLEAMFVPALPEVTFNKENVVDPFNHQSTTVTLSQYPSFRMHIAIDDIKSASESQESIVPSEGLSKADIPAGFGESVFDDAEHSIKYMVITANWLEMLDVGENEPSHKWLSRISWILCLIFSWSFRATNIGHASSGTATPSITNRLIYNVPAKMGV